MEIELHNISKRYKFEWIFKKIDYHFEPEGRYAILGSNGAGKSTFLRILSGYLTPSKGTITFSVDGKQLEVDEVYKYVTYAAPYIDVIEEFTLRESIDFHQKFKPFIGNVNTDTIIELLGFEKSRNKEVKYFSSGMKQRLKLALAILSDSKLLLLDEPTTNLDRQGMDWYQHLLSQYVGDRLLIIASNIEEDYKICDHFLDILDYK